MGVSFGHLVSDTYQKQPTSLSVPHECHLETFRFGEKLKTEEAPRAQKSQTPSQEPPWLWVFKPRRCQSLLLSDSDPC